MLLSKLARYFKRVGSEEKPCTAVPFAGAMFSRTPPQEKIIKIGNRSVNTRVLVLHQHSAKVHEVNTKSANPIITSAVKFKQKRSYLCQVLWCVRDLVKFKPAQNLLSWSIFWIQARDDVRQHPLHVDAGDVHPSKVPFNRCH